jgi:polar amino acid transport system permease protein
MDETTIPVSAAEPVTPLQVVRRTSIGMRLLTVVAVVFVAWIVYQLVTNGGFQWKVVGSYLFQHEVLHGLLLTVELTFICEAIGILLGILLAVMRVSRNRSLNTIATVYIWFFRGTPVLVQLVFWYNLASLLPTLSFGIPFGGPKLFLWSSNSVITPMIAAVVGLGLNEAAYMAEIVRGGLLSVDPGQSHAAMALGFDSGRMLRRIVLPQAMRSIIPPTGNNLIGMLKYTSLASVVSLQELTNSVETIYNRTFQTIPLLIVASLWYLALTSVLSVGQARIERHYSRGQNGHNLTVRHVWWRALTRRAGRRPVATEATA